MILSSHILAEIQEVCDYIMIISKGKLVASDTPENLEKLLTNQQTVEILAKGNEDTVRKVIGTIGNVQKASVEHGKEEGTVKASLFPKDGKDIRETVFMAFAQEGCPLLMLYHSRTTLEDVPGADAGKHTCSSKSDEGRRKERPDGKAAQEKCAGRGRREQAD